MTTVVSFKDWEFLADTEATGKAYRQVEHGGADGCTCTYCRNYVAVRHLVFPEEVRELLQALRIDLTKEVEVYTLGERMENGHFQYLGWFHFKGRILKGPRDGTPGSAELALTPTFSIGFIEGSNLTFFEEKRDLVELIFKVELPWVLDEDPEPWEEYPKG